MPTSTPLFTFAAISDSHLNPDGVENTSPWRTNRLANARNEFLVAILNDIKPAFVVHVGDIVHPLPSNPLFVQTAGYAKSLFGRLDCPFHLVPGNHDVGDKPLDWMPADKITAGFVDKYRANFGADWDAFVHHGCHFIRINSSLLNSGIPQELEQRAWLEAKLGAASGQRIFLFTHYPPYISRPDENSHYDNLDEPGRGWLLDLLNRHKVEALFAGHVHNFFYNRHGATRCYVLPSVTSLRQDYAEFFRIGPAEEYGRNDAAKLGFFLIDVYADRHVARFVRTNGLTADTSSKHIGPIVAREAAPSPVGVHLRHPWADETELPYNGPLDELSRKRVRNDYGLLAMWDLGVKRVRVPVSDLKASHIRSRMTDLCELGFQFTVFSFGVPDRGLLSLMRENRHLIDRWELILPRRALTGAIEMLKTSRPDLPAVFVSKLRGHAGAEQDASKPFDHSISLGFASSDDTDLADWLTLPGARDAFSGVAFTIESGESVCSSATALAAIAGRHDIAATAVIKLGPSGSAGTPPSEEVVSGRVAQAVLCAWCYPNVTFFLDTFQQIDRGYFLRPGLVDRRCNPSLAGQTFRDLQLELRDLGPRGGPREIISGARLGLAFPTQVGERVLWLPDSGQPFVEAIAASEAIGA